MKSKQHDADTLEIEARKELLKRLQHPAKLLGIAVEKERAERRAAVEKATEYESIEAAQELWGWGSITDAEFEAIRKVFEEGEAYIEEATPLQVAQKILGQFMSELSAVVRSLEFDRLPPEEQERIRAEHERLHDEIERRKKARYTEGVINGIWRMTLCATQVVRRELENEEADDE